ncbi:MAG: DUF2141 domain-containing protein [Thermosynechococcaceae cyanobacterium]
MSSQQWYRFGCISACVFLIGAASTGLQQPATASSTSLTVKVNGFRSQKGQLCLSLFSRAQGFPTSGAGAAQARCLKANAPQITFQNLKAGSYAVAVFHDANGDGVLNRNQIGIPTEGFGFSRNPRILTGPPRFSDSSVFLAGPGQNINIKLNYML